MPLPANLRGWLQSPLAVRIRQPEVQGLLLPHDPGILRRPGRRHVSLNQPKEVNFMLFYSEAEPRTICPVIGWGDICIAPGF